MVATALARTVTHLRQQAESPADDELLRRFANHRDEAAFAALVRRHGPMIQGVARRAVRDYHTSEDVLQATFLLLARKAPHIHWRTSIAPWLHAAAVRFARKAVDGRTRHPIPCDAASFASAELPPDQPLLWREVRSALDEELAGLPERLRSPLVLCYLQGLTRDEAAQQLGWTLATLKRRLEQGRDRLRARLARRGVSLAAALAAIVAGDEVVSAATVQAVVDAACSGTASGFAAALLSGGASRWRKCLLSIAMLLTVSVGGLWFAKGSPMPEGQPAPPAKPAQGEKIDVVGDALPDGAVARLGSARLNTGIVVQALAYSPDGTRLTTWSKEWGGTGRTLLTISDAATGRELRIVPLPPTELVALRWLSDGRGLAVAKISAREYYVWEFTNENAPFPQVDNPNVSTTFGTDIISADISPDGRSLVTGRESRDGKPRAIELWEVTPNTSLSKLKPRELGQQAGSGQFVLFSDDGQRVFALSRKADRLPLVVGKIPPARSAERDLIVVYETATGKRLSEFDVAVPMQHFSGLMAPPQRLTLSPDGKSLFVGDELGFIHIYDWNTGKETASFAAHTDGDPKKYERPGVAALAFSADGKTLYSAGNRLDLTFWDAQTWKPRDKLAEPVSQVSRIAVSPTGTKITLAEPSSFVHILDAKSGKDLFPITGHTKTIVGLAVLPDGTAVTADYERDLRRWDLTTGRELSRRQIDLLNPWGQPRLTADGRGTFGNENDQVVYLDLASGKKTQVTTDLVGRSVGVSGVSGSSAFVVTADGKFRQWDAKTGQTVRTFDPPKSYDSDRPSIGRITLSPDGRRAAAILERWQTRGQFGYFGSAQIVLYDATTGKVRRRWQTTNMKFAAAVFSADGKYLLAGGASMTGSDAPIDDALPTPVGANLMLFDAQTGEPIRSIEATVNARSERLGITALAFPIHSIVFAAAQQDGSISMYEVATGNIVRTYRSHRNTVSQIAFTADGKRLVSVSADMTGLVWDASFASLAKPSAADRDRLWVDLAKPEWELAGPSLAALASQPNQFLKLVRERLTPAIASDFDRPTLEKLVAQAADPTFAARERASTALARYNREVLPALQVELARSTNAEQRRRLQTAIEQISRSPVPSQQLRQIRVLALLEQLKSDAARAELKRLAAGHADAALSRDAKAALER